jgi:hypothetical protein
MTGLDFITRSMILAGILGQGETPSPEDVDCAQGLLNDMFDSWNTERLNIYVVTNRLWALRAGVGTYFIGPATSGPVDFDTPSITMIQNANIVYAGIRLPLDLATSVQWAAITELTNQALVPNKLYCDYQFPIASLNLNPIPQTAVALELFTWQILAAVTDLTLDFAFPTGYLEPLQYNFIVRLVPAFTNGQEATQSQIQIALDSKARLRQLNAQRLNGPVSEATSGQIPTNGLPPAAPQ